MARETKVGLLAGLAFIVCFAVILANRGAKDPSTSHAPFLPDGGGAVPGKVQQSASRTTPNAPAGSASQPGVPAGGVRSTQPLTPQRTDEFPAAPAPGSGAVLVFSDHAATREVAGQESATPLRADQPTTTPPGDAPTGRNHGQAVQLGRQPHPSGDSSALSEVTEPLPTVRGRTMDAAASQRELERRLTEAAGVTEMGRSTRAIGTAGADSSAALSNAPRDRSSNRSIPSVQGGRASTTLLPSDATARAVVSYTVAPGDTLSKIAEAHYRNKTPRFVNAIFDANRSLLADPNSIKVGMVLAVPVLETVDGRPQGESSTAAYAAAQAPAQAANRPATRSADRQPSQGVPDDPFRWYQVKKNDRYASIARDQLGNVGRWHELYELNKDKFPDPNMIREGVRIKLPSAGAASIGEASP